MYIETLWIQSTVLSTVEVDVVEAGLALCFNPSVHIDGDGALVPPMTRKLIPISAGSIALEETSLFTKYTS